MTTAVELERPPLHHHVPPHVGTYGDEVADLGATVGLDLDPEQRLLPDAAMAYDEHGRLVATEVGCAAPRQNVKTHGAKALSLADLVLFGQPDCLWTAHLRATSDDAFRNASGTGLADLFENYDFLRRMVAPGGIVDSDGEKSITLRPRRAGMPKPTLSFVTRSERGSRGLTGRRVTFDEALFLKPSMTSAMIPILSAQSMTGQVQVRYLGSAGLLMSQVWRDVRDRGRSGTEAALAWLEWAATRRPCGTPDCTHVLGSEDCALDDPALIRQANLAVDRRIHLRFVLETERAGMTPADFMVERMGWWQDPPNSGGGDLDVTRWLTLHDVEAKPARPLVLGVDQGEDRTCAIGVAWRRRDRQVQVMLGQDERVDVGLSPAGAVARLVQLHERHGARVVLGGPALGLERDLRDAGIPVTTLTGSEFATACGQLDDRITAGTVRHGAQPELDDSIGAVQWRSVGTAGERAFRLKDAPGVSPAAAVARALAGLLARPATTATPVAVKAAPGTSGLSSMQF
jgi:hypothetical protein